MPQQIIQPRFQFIYNSLVASGYKVFTYTSGTSTKKTTWTDYTKATPNSNPIVLDTQGMADIWLDGSYKIIVATPTAADPPVGADIIYTVDNVIGYTELDWSGLTASIADLNSTTTTVLSKSGVYTVALVDRNKTILVDTSGGDVTINLLTAATALSSFNITIKKIDLSTNKVIIQPNGAETVDGLTPFHLYDYNDFVEVHSDASNWKLTSSQIRGTVRTITSVTTLDLDDNNKLINCNATGGGFLVNLPANSDVGRGYRVTIKKTDATTNAITVTPSGGELIDGSSNLIENTQYGASSFVSTGTGWSVYSEFGIGVKTTLPKNFMDGMLIKNNASDTANDIDFQTGTCRDSTDTYNMKIAATITKKMDVNWAAGNNQGGRPTGVAYANDTWYDCFAIMKPDGTIDAGFDTSITAANLLSDATGYTIYQRVGSIRTTIAPAAISILQFRMHELGGYIRESRWTTDVSFDVNGLVSGNHTADVILNFVPNNKIVSSILHVRLEHDAVASFTSINVYEKAQGNYPSIGQVAIGSGAAAVERSEGEVCVLTDGSASPLVTYTTSSGAAVNVNLKIKTAGWKEFVR